MSSVAPKGNHYIDIKKFRARREMNLGIFLFAIVFIYLLVTVIMYFTGDTISVYEVREGSIVNDNSYTGLVLRQEEAVSAETGGYISYYQNGNSRAQGRRLIITEGSSAANSSFRACCTAGRS